jgi:lysophospholipase L1-like esterase
MVRFHRHPFGRRVRPAIRATCAAAGAAALVWSGVMAARWLRARSLMRATRPFSQSPPQPSERVVIAGDSTAVGVGSSHPRLSVAGRLGMALTKVQVSNVARSGARLAQVPRQFEEVERARPIALAIVLAGCNDVIRGSSRRSIANSIDDIVARVRELGGRLILVPPGRVGRAPIWLPPLSWYYTWRARRVRRAMFDAAHQHADVEVIDLAPARPADRFERRPALRYAADGLHPSDAGYGAWFERIVQQSGRLQARLTGPFKVRAVKNARTVKWSPLIWRAPTR